jgi:uncharacterized protein YkvS
MSTPKKYKHVNTEEIWYLEKRDGLNGHFCKMYDNEIIVFDMRFMVEITDDSK